MNLYRGFLSPRNEKPLVRVRSGISISEFVNSPDFLPHDDQFHDKFLWVSPSLKYATGIATTRYIGYILTNWNDP